MMQTLCTTAPGKTTEIDGVYHPPHTHAPIFKVRDIPTARRVSLPIGVALERCRRGLSENLWFRIGTLLFAESSSFENRPRGGVIHTVVYGNLLETTWYIPVSLLSSSPRRVRFRTHKTVLYCVPTVATFALVRSTAGIEKTPRR